MATDVAEDGVKDGDTVGSDDTDATKLLNNTDKYDDQEWFVHFWVVFQVSHVVTFSSFALPATYQSQITSLFILNKSI